MTSSNNPFAAAATPQIDLKKDIAAARIDAALATLVSDAPISSAEAYRTLSELFEDLAELALLNLIDIGEGEDRNLRETVGLMQAASDNDRLQESFVRFVSRLADLAGGETILRAVHRVLNLPNGPTLRLALSDFGASRKLIRDCDSLADIGGDNLDPVATRHLAAQIITRSFVEREAVSK